MTLDGNKVALALAREKLTKIQLAEKAKMSRSRLNVILNSKNVTPIAAGKLADALGVDVTEILEN